ncbi:hypothetical protein ACFQRG_17370 [Scopulibacillus cellulosilyticus]|uniref:Uncharacterized protein n=2 Tax=Scopulibacillus cellulosilyticus TaxID=2665665 RepID=A0ABW2Q5F1_9BACL
MESIILLIVSIINVIHDKIEQVLESMGFHFADKDLHFWIIGLIGIVIFIVVQVMFKIISRWSITVISLIYTFTVLLVFVFAIEIEQKVTGRGVMDFGDAASGIYGFIAFFAVYLCLRLIGLFFKKLFFGRTNSDKKGMHIKG